MSSANNQKGFTILELLIATMVFAIIFLGCTTALIQIGKVYYKDVIVGKTQETTRSVTDRISQQLQFTKDIVQVSNPQKFDKLDVSAVCIGSTRYSFALNAQVSSSASSGSFDTATNQSQHALWKDNLPSGNSCTPVNILNTNPTNQGEELLAGGMRLSAFSVQCSPNMICTVTVGVIYGDNDLLTPDPTTALPVGCKSDLGDQWCAGSLLQTSVDRRVGL